MSGEGLFGGAEWKASLFADWLSRREPADTATLDPAMPELSGAELLSSEEIAARLAPAVRLDADDVAEAVWRAGFPLVECPDGTPRWAMRPKAGQEGGGPWHF